MTVETDRAAAAEDAVRSRLVRRLWPLPRIDLADQIWPSRTVARVLGPWHYWWHAQLLDCLSDAQLRDPRPDRRPLVAALVRGIRLRNGGWRRTFYDDMAWMALALDTTGKVFGLDHRSAVEALAAELQGVWSDELGGGIPWRPGDVFKNAPANGPAALVFARTGRVEEAVRTLDWIEDTLRDPDTGLVVDGIRPGLVHRELYGYNQGTVLGAELELVLRAGRPAERIHRIVAAVADRLATDDVLPSDGFGDNGLFGGIMARYLAIVAARLPGDDEADRRTRATAARLVGASAEAVWGHRAYADGQPVFGSDWRRPALQESRDGDLSVQLGAWMALEGAALLVDRHP